MELVLVSVSVLLLLSLHSIHALVLPSRPSTRNEQSSSSSSSSSSTQLLSPLTGEWEAAKSQLRRRDCSVVTIAGIESSLFILQTALVDQGPPDLDLRARIRTSVDDDDDDDDTTFQDCWQVCESATASSSTTTTTITTESLKKQENDHTNKESCALALAELARGVASLAELSSPGGSMDVFCRIVCASNYRAREPPFHTDKAPLRGYVTLRGVGTEFMTRPCSPWEYVTLRTLGNVPTITKDSLLQAQELQFIVMKGDYYECERSHDDDDDKSSLQDNNHNQWLDKFWTRARACVHRSPPGNSGRRVIISFDLADGDDDREWYQSGTQREWRNGLTQRKSHLVA